MQYIGLLVIVALVFGICFLADKGFVKLFRSKAQHQSGKSVRLNKRYGAIGIVILALGVAAVVIGMKDPWALIIAGSVLVALGICLLVYYMSFGIYYDEDTFLLESFGKSNVTYRFEDIQYQQLYAATGHIIVELSMTDGRTIQIQSGMNGMYAFMDHAFFAWLRQKNLRVEDCPHYDPENCCWFPMQES